MSLDPAGLPSLPDRDLPDGHLPDRDLPTVGIVLAGGRSSRFGSDKLAAESDGRTLLERAVDAVAELADLVVVVAAPEREPQLGRFASRIVVTHDPEDFGGPLVGLVAGLRALEGEALPERDRGPALDQDTPVVLAGGDMPSIRPVVLRAMVEALQPSRSGAGFDAVTLAGPDAIVRPLPAVLRLGAARAASEAALAAGDRSLRAGLSRLRTRVLGEAEWRVLDPHGDSLRDVDRPEDLSERYSPRR